MEFYRLNKKLCPVCRKSIEYHAYMKVENLAVCNECDKKIYMDEEKRFGLTLDELQDHINYRRRNAELLECLHITKQACIQSGFLGMVDICVDEYLHLWYADAGQNPPVFAFSALQEFIFRADQQVITHLTRDEIKTEPEYIEAILNYPWEELSMELKIDDPYVTKLYFRMGVPEQEASNISELINSYDMTINLIRFILHN